MRKLFPILSTFILISIELSSLCLHPHHASAYQNNETTPEPVVATTPPPEEDLPVITNTPEATSTAEPVASEEAVETVISLPTETPSASIEGTPTPEPIVMRQVITLSGEYASDEVLVRFRKSASDEDIQQCLSLADAIIISNIDELKVRVVQVLPGKVAESIAAISTCPKVRYAEPNYTASIADTIPTDPGWSSQFGLINIRAPQGWDYSTGSTSVTIAILDTGVDLGHADQAPKIVPGYDFVNGDSNPQDDNGHGTHVAGIAAAIGNNGVGVAGVSWGARIMPVKVLNAGGGGFFADVADGIVWATDHGAQVINLSLGGSSNSTVLQDAVNYASGKGVMLVAAAGNTGSNFVLYPARYPNVIAVGAVDSLNNRAGISNFGPELDLVAPGVNIYSTIIGGYGYNSGTSMAAPYVSGLAAILYGVPGNDSSALVTSQMESTVLDLGSAGFDVYHGYGLIQMDSALNLALPQTSGPDRKVSPSLFAMPNVPTFVVGETDAPTPTTFPTTTFTTLPPTIEVTVSATGPEVQALSIKQEQIPRERNIPSWQMPCAGTALILIGLLLLWMAKKKKT